MSKDRCIIYGGGGFIGSHIAERLCEKGYDVSVFDKINFSRSNISSFEKKIRVIEGDFNNEVDLSESVKGNDFVYHLVSSTIPSTSNENPVYDTETNLVSSLRLFRLCAESKVKKIIFLSSGGTVYGVPEKLPVSEDQPCKPIVSYGVIKKAIEDYLFLFRRNYGLDYFVFRLSNPYGERQNPASAQGAVSVFISKFIKGESIEIWGNGDVVRDYIYIRDAAEVLAAAPRVDTDKKIFNLSTAKGYSLNELLDVIRKVTGLDTRVNYESSRSIDVPVSILDNSLVREIFGWKPETEIEEGIRRTYNYLKEFNAR